MFSIVVVLETSEKYNYDLRVHNYPTLADVCRLSYVV